jgi:hypothetical protein
MRLRIAFGGCAAALLLASSAQALQIVPTFDSSITGASNAAEIENAVFAASQFYTAFSDPVTVNIYFQTGPTPLGASLTGYYGVPYADYVTGLSIQAAVHPENAVLQSAVANLPSGNSSANVLFTSAEANTLLAPFGITVPGLIGGFDGVVMLSDTPGKVSFSGVVGPTQYPAQWVLQHEIDEVLGAGGGGTVLGRGFPPDYIAGLDLYRYNGFHSPSLTTDPNEVSYFSYDGGATPVLDYNQSGVGDYGDTAKFDCNGVQHVQDYFGCPGTPPFGLTRVSPEVLELESIGYNLMPVPEPATWALLIAGFGSIGLAARRRRAAGNWSS